MGAIKIFLGNYKGGVGKTVSTYILAAEMANHEKREYQNRRLPEEPVRGRLSFIQK